MSRKASAFGSLPLLLVSTVLRAELNAEVDRTLIHEGETLRYTLRSDQTNKLTEPDFSAFKEKFHIVRTEKSRQIHMTKGRYNVWLEWVLTLRPKTSGSLTIPSVHLDQQISNAVSVRVSKPEDRSLASLPPPVFMQSQLKRTRLWQGQETLLTLQILARVRFTENPDLTPPEAEGVAIKLLSSDKREERIIQGIPYRVMLVEYMVTPTRTGEMTLPEQQLSGTIADNDPLASHSLLRMTSTRPFHVTSTPVSLQVKAIPAQWPADTPWLPAEHLALSERWSADPDQIKAGESITRTVTVHVKGVHSSQIAPLAPLTLAQVKSYNDLPETQDKLDPDGQLSGTRRESTALLFTTAGQYRLPQITVTWFNVNTQSLETCSLPERTLQVGASPDSVLPGHQPRQETAAALAPTRHAAETGGLQLWKWGCALLVTGWLTTLLLWWKAGRQGPHAWLHSRRKKQDPVARPAENEAQAFKAVLDACAGTQPTRLEQALLHWGKLLTGIEACSATDIVEHLNMVELSHAWRTLQQDCYGRQEREKSEVISNLKPLLKRARQQWRTRQASAAADRSPQMRLNPLPDSSQHIR